MTIKSFILTTLVAILLVAPAMADTVNGKIINSAGLPVAGATIEVFSTGFTATTNIAGFFTLNLPQGTYVFHVIPPAGALLAPMVVGNVVVNGPTNIGNQVLTAGFLLSGTVTDGNGVVIVNGDLDVFDDLSGVKLNTPGDKTSPTGTFSLRVPGGALRLRAEPGPGQVLVSQIQDVNMVSNLSVGTIVLPQGFQLTGVVRHATTNVPLLDVDIDVDDLATGLRIQTPGDNTDATGTFSVIVPAGVFTVSFEPLKGQQILVGKRVTGVFVPATSNMGNILLDPGITVSGTLVNNAGFPVTGADLDVRSQAGDAILYTPGDKTAQDGTFFVVIPTGMHRVIFQPKNASGLLSQSTPFQQFTGNTPMGNVIAQPGHLLSGNVSAFGGVPQTDCSIIVHDSTTGAIIEVANKRTYASGNYGVLVPTGTFDVDVRTKKGSLAQDITVSSVIVSGPKTLNASLSLLPMLVFVDDPAFPGPQVVLAGQAQIFITFVIYNPNGITTGTLVDVEIEDPFGGISTIVSGSPVVLGSGQYIFAQFLPVPLSPAAPGNSGLPHKFIIRLRHPTNGSEIDVDEFVYFPQ